MQVLLFLMAVVGFTELITGPHDGPFMILDSMRKKFKVFQCPYCTGFWVALVLSTILSFSFQNILLIGAAECIIHLVVLIRGYFNI